MSGHLVTSLTLLSTLLLASAQLATFPKRLRRGSAALDVEEGNGLHVAVNVKGEFGRARQLDSFSMSMTVKSISFSLDLVPAAMEFDFEDETSMATVAPTYYPTYVPTEKEIIAPLQPTTSPSYWPTYIPTAGPVAQGNSTEGTTPETPQLPAKSPSYSPTYIPTAAPNAKGISTKNTTSPTYNLATPLPTTASVGAPTQEQMQPLSNAAEMNTTSAGTDAMLCTKDRDCNGDDVCHCDFFCRFCFLKPCGVCGPL